MAGRDLYRLTTHGARRLSGQLDALLAAACLMLFSMNGAAETLRVTTWNLAAETTGTSSALVTRAADELRGLNPDIILLQQVADWHMCEQLAEALQPLDYSVVICSAFRESALLVPKPQVAILSRNKAYFTWSEAWPSRKHQNQSDGVAFAAIQAGTYRLGFFSGLFNDQAPVEQPAQRLLGLINSINHWETNQVQSFVIGASFDPSSGGTGKSLHQASLAFEEAGLVDGSEELLPDTRATCRPMNGRSEAVADCLFAGRMVFPSNPRISPVVGWQHYPVTCDVELDSDKVAAALDLRAENRREQDARSAIGVRRLLYVITPVSLLGLAIVAGIRARARNRARASLAARTQLPARVIPGKAVRPVIFSQRPVGTGDPEPPSLPRAARAALRLRSASSVQGIEPGKNASTETAQPDQAMTRQQPAHRPEPVLRKPSAAAGAEEIADPVVRQGVIQELAGWLKQKFVRKLVSDRTQLMEAHQIAAKMANTLDGRLARIEAQIQQQNQAYAHRIEELNKELAAAREENRELIRERIARVKAEMEAARARVLAEANLDSTSFRL